VWNLSLVVTDQVFRERDDILGLGVEQADRLDRVAQLSLTERDHLLGRFHTFEQWFGRNIYAGIGGLRGQHDRHKQGVGIVIFQLGRRRRIIFGQPAKEFEDFLASH